MFFWLFGGFLELNCGNVAKVGVRRLGRDREKMIFCSLGDFLNWILDIWQKWECDIQEETEKRQMIFCSLGNFWNQILDIWQKWGCDIEDETEKN